MTTRPDAPDLNAPDRETALRMWTENVTWFCDEEGKKARIQVRLFADFMMRNRDYFACAKDEIADIASNLTMVGGNIVNGDGAFFAVDEGELPPAMPDWSPVRCFGGYGALGDVASADAAEGDRKLAMNCGCANACVIHGHNHALARAGRLPISDLKSFWGVLECACWAI